MAKLSWVKLPRQGATPVLDLSSLGLPHDKDLQRKARKALEHPTDFCHGNPSPFKPHKGVSFKLPEADKKIGKIRCQLCNGENLRQ